MSKVIISAAITGGVHTPTMSPYLPWKPEDIADQAIEAAQAGAAVAHIHARDPRDGRPTADLELFGVIVDRSKNVCITRI